MLVASPPVVAAFQEQGLRALRQRILIGWSERLPDVARLVGEERRAMILDEIEFASRDDIDLTVGELQMLADLRLTAVAAEMRAARR